MTFLDVVTTYALWFANGLMAVLYWIIGHFFTVLSCLVALVIAFGIDPFVQSRASDRPRRYGRGEVHTAAPVATYLTLGVAAFWGFLSSFSQFPVPLIGFVLWVIGLLAILVVSEERTNVLYWVKVGILVYGVFVLAFRGVQAYISITDPAAWATFVGTSSGASEVLIRTRQNIATIGILFLFFLYPAMYAGMLFNRAFRNPKPNFNLFREAGDVIRRIRTREP